MFGQFSRSYQGKRTVSALRDIAFDRYGKAVHNTRRTENNTLDVDLYADKPADPIRAIILHETPIVEFLRDGRVRLDSGGWQTVTTKDRMSRYMPSGWFVASDRGWYVRTPGEPERVPYFDGITFNPDGSLTPDSKRRVWSTEARREADKKLIAKAIKSLKTKGVPHSPKGDPWVLPDSKTGLFEAGMVREWLRADYLTQSLCWAALNWAGAGSVDVGRPWYLQGLVQGNMPHALNFVRRYLKACLGVGA